MESMSQAEHVSSLVYPKGKYFQYIFILSIACYVMQMFIMNICPAWRLDLFLRSQDDVYTPQSVEALAFTAVQLNGMTVTTLWSMVICPKWIEGQCKALPWAVLNILGSGLLLIGFSLCTKDGYFQRGVPSWQEVLYEVMIGLLLFEAMGYFSHRLVHASSKLYRNIHYLHHIFPYEVPLATYVAHPVDFSVVITIPAVLGFYRVHLLTFLGYVALGQLIALWIHTEAFMSDAHEKHHATGKVNYSFYGWMDILFKTAGELMGTGHQITLANIFLRRLAF
jgi:hypothetical protein